MIIPNPDTIPKVLKSFTFFSFSFSAFSICLSIKEFAIFILLILIKNKRKYKGQITYIYLVLYSLARMFIEGLRIDSLMLYNLRISQILSLFIFVIFCIIMLYKRVKIHKTAQSNAK